MGQTTATKATKAPRTSRATAQRAIALARNDLAVYCALAWPRFEMAQHHRLVIEKLEAVERGEIDRLMIFLPPRHGKSLIASQLFPPWYLGRNPERSVIAASYGAELALDFGRRVRNLVADRCKRPCSRAASWRRTARLRIDSTS
jgi:hypothetical protein